MPNLQQLSLNIFRETFFLLVLVIVLSERGTSLVTMNDTSGSEVIDLTLSDFSEEDLDTLSCR